MSRLSVALRLTWDALVYFFVERFPLITSYLDFALHGQTSVPRLVLLHAAFFFRKSVSLLPDAAVSLALILNMLALIDRSVDYQQIAFILVEGTTFLFGRERRRQRRRRNFQASKLREPLLCDRPPTLPIQSNTPLVTRHIHQRSGAGNFFFGFETGIDVHVVSYGPGFGETQLVCLHQFGSGTFTFDRLANELRNFQQHFSELYAFDRPGHGDTSRPEDVTLEIANNVAFYSSECAVRITERLLREICGRAVNQPIALVGCGQGALVALEVAAKMRSEISGLVLISPPTEDAEFADGLPRVVKSAALTKVATQISSALLKAELGDFLVKRAWHKPQNLPDDLLEKYRQATKKTGWTEAIIALIKNYKKRDIHQRLLLPRLLPQELPVLVIVGEKDRVIREPRAQEFVSNLKIVGGLEATLVVMNECGHVPHEEKPKEVAELIGKFLERIPRFTRV
jgi:pimeloyl-ACP methyl ester carboxylesterase